MSFGPLRVINEDLVQPGEVFPTHGHENMEIISYVLEGALEHKDSIGTGAQIKPGEVQRMSVGTGIRNSEDNPLSDEVAHFLQIWIIPDTQDIEPGYEQKMFERADRQSVLKLVGAKDACDGTLKIHQNVDLYSTILSDGDEVSLPLRDGRRAWVQVAQGSVLINGSQLNPGDGAAITDDDVVSLSATSAAEVLIFDMA
jgi:redox-sensitive bicupin YhaK (pirin superfamily)